MATYQPPTEQLQEFNSFVFRTNDTPLTINIGEDRFLRFNRAQGTEYFQDLVISGKLSTISDDIYGLIYGYQTTSPPTDGFSYFNTAFGYQAGKGYNTLSGGGLNSVFGAITMPTITGIAILNTAVGHQSLWSLTTGSGNVGIGVNTTTSTITTGDANTCIGYNAKSFGNGSNSTIIGVDAVNTNGGVSIGIFAGNSIKSTSCLRNIAIGLSVFGVQGNTKNLGAGSNDNIGIGFNAVRQITGTATTRNIGIGTLTIGANQSSITDTTGTDMVCVGSGAGQRIIGASFSTLVGAESGCANSINGIETATGNTAIGYRSATNINNSGINRVDIGRLTGVNFSGQDNCVVIGNNSLTTGANQIRLGSTNWDVRWEKVAPLYTTVPTYTSANIGFIQTAVITYPTTTTNVIASYSAQAGTWCVSLVLNMLGGPTILSVRNAGTAIGFVARQTIAGIDYYVGSNYTVVSTGTATLDVLPLAGGTIGTNGGSAGQFVIFVRIA
jgi:hypothetical protein